MSNCGSRCGCRHSHTSGWARITVAGRAGLLYEKCDGRSLMDELARHPMRLFACAHMMADLHATLHACPIVADVPVLHDELTLKLRETQGLPDDLRQAMLKALTSMPQGRSLCHGDFHPANIMLNSSGAVIIDWVDSSVGNPLADVARTSILLLGFAAVEATKIEQFVIRLLHSLYLRRYFSYFPNGRAEYQRWLPIMAAARLHENIPNWQAWLLEQASKLS